MKRRKKLVKGAALGAALTGAALGLTGCSSLYPQTVYAPPPDGPAPFSEETTVFDPADMPVEDVYGPPVEAPDGFDESEEEADAFDETTMPVETVYGPPSAAEAEE